MEKKLIHKQWGFRELHVATLSLCCLRVTDKLQEHDKCLDSAAIKQIVASN